METHQDPGLVVVGAGQAGSELALAARQNGWDGPITLLGEEAEPPYQRPPLSKGYLAGKVDAASLALRSAGAYAAAGIGLRTVARVSTLDRAARELVLDTGERLPYRKLAVCTGGRPRPLVCDGLAPGATAANLFYLRSRTDADAIRASLSPGARLVVIGGGYVGLEVAASARQLGAQVTVLEAQPRVLARVAGAPLSAFYQRVHEAAGVEVHTGVCVCGVELAGGCIDAVVCTDGRRFEADLVVAGLGMLPNVEFAQGAGLVEAGGLGIAVDSCALTADPDIVAAGDCTVQHLPLYGRTVRIESVPNALEQARAAAASLCGKPKPHLAVPWFWSDQYDLKLQLAGLSQGYDRCVLRGDTARRSFCAFYLRGGRLLAVDAVNRPGDFMLARRALAQRPEVDADRLQDETVPLKELIGTGAALSVAGKP